MSSGEDSGVRLTSSPDSHKKKEGSENKIGTRKLVDTVRVRTQESIALTAWHPLGSPGFRRVLNPVRFSFPSSLVHSVYSPLSVYCRSFFKTFFSKLGVWNGVLRSEERIVGNWIFILFLQGSGRTCQPVRRVGSFLSFTGSFLSDVTGLRRSFLS